MLTSTEKHPGARDILVEVRKKSPTVSMATVYYTLNLLKKRRSYKRN
jgi:Fe2+ or Zn2+ uptake regulation protein